MKKHTTQIKGKILRMDNDALSAELRRILTGRHRGAVKNIAGYLGISESTAYDYLNGRIRISTEFLQAAVIASDNDPEIIAFLIPKGYKLTPCDCEIPGTNNIQKEMSDIYRSASRLHETVDEALQDGKISSQELIEIINKAKAVQCETEQVLTLCKSACPAKLTAV